MKTVRVGILVFAACSIAPALQAQRAAESCTACHKGPLTLVEWNATDLAARLRDFRDGRLAHVVPMPNVDDEALEALAAELAGPKPAR